MTPDEFVAALAAIGWSQRQLVTLLGCDTNLATRWSRGTAAIPPSIAKWLAKLAACHERLPVPTDWRVR
jgi:transcriptional regulator with XRE-family HTH domain